MFLLGFWVGVIDPAIVFLSTKFDLTWREGEILGVGEFGPLYPFEFVCRVCHIELIWLNGNIQCAVEHAVQVQAQSFEIGLLFFDAPIFGVGFRWTGRNVVSFFEAGGEGDPVWRGQVKVLS